MTFSFKKYSNSDPSIKLLTKIVSMDSMFLDQSWDLDSWQSFLRRSTGSSLLFAHNDLGPLGFILCEIDLDGLWCHLLKIAVLPDWRKLGLGRQLFDRMCSELCNSNSVISLELSEKNTEALNFYKNLGMVSLPSKGRYSNGDIILKMQLNLGLR